MGPDEDGIANAVEVMLSGMVRRGSVIHTITLKISRDENLAVGVCENPSDLVRVHEELVDDSVLVDGNFWGKEEAAGIIQSEPKRLDALLGVPGAFSFLALTQSGLVAGRDVLGQKPLYYGTDREGRCTFATLKSALALVGVSDPQPVPPGELLKAENPTPKVSALNKLAKPQEKDVPEEIAREKIGDLLREAVSRTVPEGSAIAFSGGIDSSLTAHAVKKLRLHTELVSVGLEGQPELEHADQVAKAMDLKLKIRRLAEDDVLDILPLVVETVESTDPMVVST